MMKNQPAQSPKTSPATPPKKNDEHILVVACKNLFSHNRWNGIQNTSLQYYVECIQQHKEFLPRSLMEHDQHYKQIIPYLIFMHNNRFFLMQRQGSASEQRLKNNYSLGIGGHIRKEDLQGSTSIFDWAQREFHEEVSYSGSLTVSPLGVLNDDSNDVGKVHLGLVLLLQGDSDQISIKSELKSGRLVDLATCKQYEQAMENWSKHVVALLCEKFQ